MAKFQPGTKVRLKKSAGKMHTCPKGRRNHRTAKVLNVIAVGQIMTDRDLRGCRYWNVEDLVHA